MLSSSVTGFNMADVWYMYVCADESKCLEKRIFKWVCPSGSVYKC